MKKVDWEGIVVVSTLFCLMFGCICIMAWVATGSSAFVTITWPIAWVGFTLITIGYSWLLENKL
jgi:hypothetical protein